SVIALGNNPNDFARSGRLFRKRDPFNQLKKRRELGSKRFRIETNIPLADDPLINDPQPTEFIQIGALQPFHNVDTLNILLLYIRTKEADIFTRKRAG
ncbi:hypothetical protein C8R42DRAFT_776526, partial [Lentinula raphanica]